MQRHLLNFLLAIEGVMANKLRALLTGLGIMFGVGAVIAMLAIGNGAKQAILEQMKLVGTNNIVIRSIPPGGGADDGGEEENEQGEGKNPWSPGLNLRDAAAVEALVPTVEQISPEVVLPTTALRAGQQVKTRVVGVTNSFFILNNLSLESGQLFHDMHMEKGRPVCIIGQRVENKLFSGSDPIGQSIKCGKTWLRVVGVMRKRNAQEETLKNLGIRDYNDDVYVPVNTALRRFKDRSLITRGKLAGRRGNNAEPENYHQVDRLVLRVDEVENLRATRDIVARMLMRRHREVLDYEIEIPELLIEQQQKTQDTFNLVLAAIAGISLLVGGIGIMNIMLASVLERIKEIGIRRSLGATRQDIITQFLFEAVFISLLGGLFGILIGILAARLIAGSADIPTVVSGWSILLSFGVAASVGLVFGIFPAQRAARQDPIKALRSD